MKFFLILVTLVMLPSLGYSKDIVGAENYRGNIDGVGLNFYGHVGVGLPAGETCHGNSVAILKNSHAQYDKMFATLLAAEASNKNVRIYQLGAETENFGGNIDYCVINFISLGDFPLW